MKDIFLRAASVVAIVSTLFILWQSSRSKNLSMLAYAAGIAGGLMVLADALDRRAPQFLVGIGFLLAVAATYVWLFRRERARGGGMLDALEIVYQPRLSWFERSVSLALGTALVTLTWLPPELGLIYRIGGSAIAAVPMYMGISGRPPRGTVRTATPNERAE